MDQDDTELTTISYKQEKKVGEREDRRESSHEFQGGGSLRNGVNVAEMS